MSSPVRSAPEPDPRLQLLQTVLADAGHSALATSPLLSSWCDATRQLLGKEASGPDLTALTVAWRWSEMAAELHALPRQRWSGHLGNANLAHHLTPESFERLIGAAATPEEATARIAARELLLGEIGELGDAALRDRVSTDTRAALALLETLRSDGTALGRRVRALFPELGALAIVADAHAAAEHERAENEPAHPLLDHLERVLGRKLLGLEEDDRARFQRDQALSAAAFREEVQRFERLRSRGLLSCVRWALLHLDFAKGGDPARRAAWTHQGADLSVHNEAARFLLQHAAPPPPSAHTPLLFALVESHGLTGQAVRGETPFSLFARFVRYLRIQGAALATSLGVSRSEAHEAALDALHFVNVCDTAGVREGLYTDALRAEMEALEGRIGAVADFGAALDETSISAELAADEDRRWAGAPDSANRARLGDRLRRLRQGREQAGEPRADLTRVVASLSDATVAALLAGLRHCQLWYAEAATGALTPEAQVKLLALAVRSASELGIDTRGPYHLSLLPLVGRLRPGRDASVPYRLRLVETLLASVSVAGLLAGERPGEPLGTFATEIGGARALAMGFEESDEARALLTLLPIYERKSSAAFHATLKALCDLYGLRKDEFDRVANESLYLVTMNSARSDKARLLDHVRPGRTVEVGPGGGVVLDLLEERFAESEILGIDASRRVIEALEERKAREGHRWKVIQADAYALPALLGESSLDTVVFCSVLHEIYSYVEFPSDETGVRGRFRLEAVRELLRAAYRTLRPGGRIVIRDGVMPPPGTRILELVAPDAREFFDLFVKQFEGRAVHFEALGPTRVKLSSADAMEFLYTYTWGPASFPYEVREQYGVLPYDEYRDRIVSWLTEKGEPPRWIALPPHERSYLQPGYERNLAGKVRLFDESGAPVRLPDSNCLLVFEKPAPA
jgi:SAM-dependent methyltransferase